MTLLGVFAFVCFFIADCNDWKIHTKYLSWLFMFGALILLISTVFQFSFQTAPIQTLLPRIIVLILSTGCLIMLIRCLFFSFPAKDAYVEPGKQRAVYTGGDYAYCRHPGFWWLLFVMLGLYLGAGLPLFSFASYTICNFILILFEDRFVFPSVLSGYEQYKKKVPMLVPVKNK